MRPCSLVAFVVLAGCSFSESGPRYDSGLEGLDLIGVQPGVLVPGTIISVEGRSFVEPPWGETELWLAGRVSDGDEEWTVDVRAPAAFVDFEHLEVNVTEELVAQIGTRQGDFAGTALVSVVSAVDGEVHASREIELGLALRRDLEPVLGQVQGPSTVFVNDELVVEGADMLLGGAEGRTYAEVSGCFAALDQEGQLGECAPVGPVEAPVTPATWFDRTRGWFPLGPEIVGIRAGEFHGEVRLRNAHGGGAARESAVVVVDYQVTESQVLSVAPDAVSLGQYVDIEGAGFVGGSDGQVTLLHLLGEYVEDGAPGPLAIDTILVPEFVGGRKVRYAVNQDDDLGRSLELRTGAGRFVGQIIPIVSHADDEVIGAPLAVDLRVAPVVQVVYLDFTPQYTSSLAHFGLRAVDAAIRDRVVEVVRRDYRTVNVDIRTERPADFAVYSEVQIGGPDPNGLGLIGYDNTPGKDVGNLRLHDLIGGVNATTQADGYPGYGGVFVESMFIFSEHPEGHAPEAPGQDAFFDEIFDRFRPDQDGDPVRAADLDGPVAAVPRGGCPGGSRQEQIECAVWVLGSLIGTTVSHELGHSLGLANPGGAEVHLTTDKPDRLMEAGAGRTFRERAELGEGPGMFCDQEYVYLRTILPSEEPEDGVSRPDCL